jgi:hypothetical protein
MNFEKALRSFRDRLTVEQRKQLKHFLSTRFRGLQRVAASVMLGSNLDLLAIANASDKNIDHRYTQHYRKFLSPVRRRRINLLEIGVGGYGDPRSGGASLRMWRSYFPKGRIYGIDIDDKSFHDERRIKTFQGSQADTDFLRTVVETIGPIDIIIDDGSHQCEHAIISFECLFPLMSERGVYAIEDVQTSYWETFGGNDQDPDRPDTIVGYFKRLIHGLNYEERPSFTCEPSFFDKNILGISFYHNLIIIEKGPNTEGSNRSSIAGEGPS